MPATFASMYWFMHMHGSPLGRGGRVCVRIEREHMS